MRSAPAQQRHATAAATAPAAPARTAARSAGDGRDRLLIRPASIGASAGAAGDRAAPTRVIRMAALWRRTLLAPTRSTPCFGSASSPRRSSSSRSTARLLYAAAAQPGRARRRAAPGPRRRAGIQLRVGGALTAFAAVAPRPRRRLHRQGPRDARHRPGRPAGRPRREPLKIEATGQQWLWRYDYPNGAFSYYKLVVPVDTAVELELVSTDVVHTWDVPDLRRQARRRARQDQPSRLPRRRGRHLRGRVGDPLRPGLRGDANRGRGRLRRRTTKTSSSSQKADIQAAQDRVVGLIEDGRSASERERPAPSSSSTAIRRAGPRWIELATSADHKDVGRMMIGGRPRLPLRRPGRAAADAPAAGDPREHLPLAPSPSTACSRSTGPRRSSSSRSRSRSASSTTSRRCRSAPAARRCPGSARSALWLYIAGATVLYAGFLFTPSEAGVNPLRAALRARLPLQQRGRRLGHRDRPGDARLRPDRDQPGGDAARMRAPGMAWRRVPVFAWAATICSWLLLVIGPVMLARDHDAADRPQLRRHLLRRRLRRRAAALAAPELDLLHRRLHADPGRRPRRDRRDRPGLRPQAALQPRRGRSARWSRSPSSAPSPGCRTCSRPRSGSAGCTSRW